MNKCNLFSHISSFAESEGKKKVFVCASTINIPYYSSLRFIVPVKRLAMIEQCHRFLDIYLQE